MSASCSMSAAVTTPSPDFVNLNTIKYADPIQWNITKQYETNTVVIDGNTVLTVSDYIEVQYYIYFPNFVKGYQDNLTVKLGDTVLQENTDFTNGFDKKTASMDFNAGPDWTIAAGGVPTHVYEKQVFPASCTTDGYTINTCSCGESIYTAYDQIAQGHVWNDGVITIEESKTMLTELDLVEGMQFDRGYISAYMATDMDKMEAVLDNPYILITDKKISSIQEILPLLEQIVQAGKKLVIVAVEGVKLICRK